MSKLQYGSCEAGKGKKYEDAISCQNPPAPFQTAIQKERTPYRTKIVQARSAASLLCRASNDRMHEKAPHEPI